MVLVVMVSGCAPPADLDAEVLAALGPSHITGVDLPPRTVVLTYDDGPDDYTLELARYLRESGVAATFFVNGSRFCRAFSADGGCALPPETRPCGDGRMQAPPAVPRFLPESVLDELQVLGHGIANHSHDHCHLPGESSAAALVWQLQATQEILDRHLCRGPALFRAPYGEWTQRESDLLAAEGGALGELVGPVGWDVDGGDWDCWRRGLTPEQCTDGYLALLEQRPEKNGILLLHDRPSGNVGYAGPLLMARLLVPRLRAAGYAFATLEEALPAAATPGGAATGICALPSTGARAAGGGGCQVAVGGAGASPPAAAVVLALALRLGRRRARRR